MFFLVEFNRNWADECDVYGFRVIDDATKKLMDDTVEKYGKNRTSFYFGTNEGWDGDTLSDIFDSYKFTEISVEQRNVLAELFPSCIGFYGYGYIPDIENYFVDDNEGDYWDGTSFFIQKRY